MSLRFFAGGGQPPQSHEVLRLAADGRGWYLTGMPWPEQPPFDEIGVYDANAGSGVFEHLAGLARQVIADRADDASRYADAGGESLRLEDEEATWSPRERRPAASAFVTAAREQISAARRRPLAVVRAEPVGEARLVLTNRGERPLPVREGEVRAGWGPVDHPPSPLRLAGATPTRLELPPALDPGARLEIPAGAAEAPTDAGFETPYALIGLRWRPDVPGEPEELNGWLIASGA